MKQIGIWRTIYEECNNIKTEQSSSKQIMVVSDPDYRAVCFLLYYPQCIAASVFD